MILLYKPKELIDFLSTNNIKPKRTLSQNFLIDKNSIDIVINIADISKEDIVLEIGPGLGALTFEIINKAKKVIAIEKDDFFSKNLKEKNIDNLKIYKQDFLDFDLTELKKFNKKIKVISAIPYHITSKIITKLLKHHFLFSSIVLIIQKETAQKIFNEKQGGFFSFLVNFFSEMKICKNISKTCFFPKPKVDSAIIELKIKNAFLNKIQKDIDLDKFVNFVKIVFLHRRKNIFSSIKAICSKEMLLKVLNELNIDKNIRCENLSFNDFLALYKKLF